MSSNIILRSDTINKLLSKQKNVKSYLESKNGNIIGLKEVGNIIADLVNVVLHGIVNSENGYSETPTNSKSNNKETKSQENSAKDIDISSDSNNYMDEENENQTKVSSDPIENRLSNLENLMHKMFNKLNYDKNIKSDRKNFNKNKMCWKCGKFGHISSKCWNNPTEIRQKKFGQRYNYNRNFKPKGYNQHNSQNRFIHNSTEAIGQNHFLYIPNQLYGQPQQIHNRFIPQPINTQILNPSQQINQ